MATTGWWPFRFSIADFLFVTIDWLGRASVLLRALFALDIQARALRKKGTHCTTHKLQLYYQLRWWL